MDYSALFPWQFAQSVRQGEYCFKRRALFAAFDLTQVFRMDLGAFRRVLLRDIRRQIDVDPKFKEGKTIELFDWASARLFLASGPALYGDGIFDGAETILEDFRTFDDMFAMRIALPMWMTKSFAIARTRIQNVLGPKFAEGLRDPSSFVKKRIEVIVRFLSLTADSREIWI